ncbi:hypothetical protein C0995_007960 [Termitomyces sp. Mi166|nr:hypothetical protein C0995_007960 [Termitomyces sp. Mi166\
MQADSLLAAELSVPAPFAVVHARFAPRPDADPLPAIDRARNLLLPHTDALLGSLLASVHIAHNPFIHVFAVTHIDATRDAAQRLAQLQLDGLVADEPPSFFTFDDLYPCSLLSKPCPSCTNPTPPSLLPRKPLREIYSHFLEAIRVRLIDDIVQAASHSRPVTRLKGGFLLGSPSFTNEWCSGWEYRVQSSCHLTPAHRPLLYCQLQVHLCRSSLIIHPLLHPTNFLPLSCSLPVPPGTPITLLPYGTPAFFLAHYNGPTSALTKQFQQSLQGLGVGSWSSTSKPSYIIAWINVENKQGEDKGIVLIYPTALCLSFTPSSIPPRPPLEHIPSLPTALQPSPQMSNQPPPSAISSSTPQTPYPPPSSQPHPVLPSSPTSDSARALRALTLSKSKDVRQVAAEVAGYVDAIARDREKERERLKRERETVSNASTSPKLARSATATQPPASAPLLTTPLSLASQPPVAGPSHPPPPNFYPSPPQATDATPHTGPTSPPAFLQTPSTSILDPLPTPSEPPPAPVVPPPPQSTFDPFSTTDASSWAIQPQPYLGMNMNMDMDMDFDMGIGMAMNMSMSFDVNTSSRDTTFAGPSRTVDTGGSSGLDFDETAFTDDDFSFFDRPSAPAVPVPRTMPISTTTILPTPAAARTPLSLGPSSPLFAVDIPPVTPHNVSAPPWVSTSDATHAATPAVPDLLPPSPGPTPPSHSAPATPTAAVHLEPFISSNSTFDPIPFADYHRLLDGKYAVGKFSLPSPPHDLDDRTEAINAGGIGWRKDYMAATDPRIGVVRKLIGVKRKLTFEQGGKVAKTPISPSWVDDWSSPTSTSAPSPDADIDIDSDTTSSSASSSRSPSPSPPHSRPTTPPPAYLPLGPTLLPTHFAHSSLLPLSTPLRRPSSPLPLPLPPSHPHIHPAASALTPVSPAATLGQSKSLEAAAGTVAIEAVENPSWAEAWRASTLVGARAQREVWLADVRAVSQLFANLPGLEGSMTLGSLFCDSESRGNGKEKEKEKESKIEDGKGKLRMLEAPMIAIGKGDAVIQVLPTALRFWEKLGLGPKGGAKNGTAFVLFEDDGEQRMQQVATWLETVATSYEGRHFGTLTPASLITSFPASQSSIVFIVTPMPAMTLASPTLRQIFSAITKASKTYSEAQIHFQLVPEQLLHSTLINPAFDYSTSDICCSIYNRILVPVDRTMSRNFFEHGVRVRKYFQEPALTLARPIYSKATFVRAAHASLDVMDRETFLHVGYQVSQCGKLILAACVDQRGEAHDLGVWLMQTPGEADSEDVSAEVFLVQKVWQFAIQFAKKANVEWRIVFSKLGAIGENELDAWTSCIDNNSRGLRISSFTLLSVEPDAPWTFISTRSQIHAPKSPPTKVHNPSRASSSTKMQPQNIFTDITTTVFATSPYNSLPQSYPPSFADLGIFLSHVPEDAGHSATSGLERSPTLSLPHPLPLIPRSSSTLICIPATPSPTSISMLHLHLLHNVRSSGSTQDIPSLHTAITHNFHELAVLARVRWRLNGNPILPFHLAAVEAMRIALGRDQYGIDIADNAT